jgi:hypothetical protein
MSVCEMPELQNIDGGNGPRPVSPPTMFGSFVGKNIVTKVARTRIMNITMRWILIMVQKAN